MTVPFFGIAVIVLLVKKDKGLLLVFLVAAGYTILRPTGISDYSASIWFIFSYRLFKSKRTAIIFGALNVFLIGVRCVTTDYTVLQCFVLLLAFVAIYFLYYYLFVRESNKTQSVNNTNVVLSYDLRKVNFEVIEIVQLRCKGYDWWEINDIMQLNIQDRSVNRRVTDAQKKLGFKTREQFIYEGFSHSSKSGRIDEEPDNLDSLRDIL